MMKFQLIGNRSAPKNSISESSPRVCHSVWFGDGARLIVEALGGASLAENSDGLLGCTWALFLVGARFSRIPGSAPPRFNRDFACPGYDVPPSLSQILFLSSFLHWIALPTLSSPPPSFHFCSLPIPPSLSLPSSMCVLLLPTRNHLICLEKRPKFCETPFRQSLPAYKSAHFSIRDPESSTPCRLLMSNITISN